MPRNCKFRVWKKKKKKWEIQLNILWLDFCDFCQCTFPDNVTNRRNHNEGTLHMNNRKLHYDWYKGKLFNYGTKLEIHVNYIHRSK
jgi:hypothetical protein